MRLGQFMSDEISCALHPYGLSIQQFNVFAYCVVAKGPQLLFNTYFSNDSQNKQYNANCGSFVGKESCRSKTMP
ncbi:MAG: hypothetical protein CM15mP83_6660 [Flavobacteriaceae bacterium]|nr:MAG: hypothetical protein CM15mP83_6660 [Flavobacteriaceae bacterium]